MRHPSISTKKPLGSGPEALYKKPVPRPVMADSAEVQELYYTERVTTFSAMLDELNILQDAPEIEFLCREIIEAREMLRSIYNRKNYAA
jgi:hypothetical protein